MSWLDSFFYVIIFKSLEIPKKAKLSKERIQNTDGKTTFLGLTDKITLKSEKILYDEENHRLYWLSVLIGDIKIILLVYIME